MYSFNPADKSLVIPLSTDLLSYFHPSIEINGQQLVRKDELHLTAIGFGRGKVILESMGQHPDLLSHINSLLSSKTFLITLIPEAYYYIQKEYRDKSGKTSTRHSVIQAVECPDLMQFYEELNQFVAQCPDLANHTLLTKEPFPHITLYTDPANPVGIGVDSADVFNQLQPHTLAQNALLSA
jgi:hypothetical protein